MSGQEIYNAQIAPLMDEIDRIATKHGISYVAAFQYAEDRLALSCALKSSTHRSLWNAESELREAILEDADEVKYTPLS